MGAAGVVESLLRVAARMPAKLNDAIIAQVHHQCQEHFGKLV